MEITVRYEDEVPVLQVTGDMDYYSAYRLREAVRKLTAANAARLIIDLNQVPYLDSSAMGTLVSVHAELRKKGFLLQITGIQGSVKSALELTRLVGALPIASSVDQALRRLASEQERGDATDEP
ncbi:MAG: STAS domain-containing protein [Spirochaetales bacterium]|nr:STAS domain-containing protein [Spirochaetales bacterium]